MNIENAIIIAMKAHYGQKDKCGDPYILHPLWVMSRMYTEDEKVCAVLHDVVEDTDITLNMLKNQGLTDIQAEAINLLTHKNGIPYMWYIAELSSNRIARKVKIADLEHNRMPDRQIRAIDNGADEKQMIKKQRLYTLAYMGLIKEADKYWFLNIEA